MRVMIQVVGFASGRPCEAAGHYVKRYEPDVPYVSFTPEPREAKKFRSPAEAAEEWNRVSMTHPVRADGRPNKPLTAFNVLVVPYEPRARHHA